LRIRESVATAGRVQFRSALRSLMRLSGRSFTYRVGRLLMNEARFDVPNDPASNGERELQATVLHYRQPNRKTVIFDVGANVGDWACSLLNQAEDLASLEVHAFEPCSGTYEILLGRIAALRVSDNVIAVRKACSSSAGVGGLHIVGVGAGTNSLTCMEHSDAVEQVELVSIDDYCHSCNIDHISLLKIDAEGHDIDVIKGATSMLQRQNVDVLQFEYNQRWIFNGAFLRDAFGTLSPFGYSIGKVTPYGVEFYESWDWELETFRGNYLACLPQWISRFNSIVPSWNPRLLVAGRNS